MTNLLVFIVADTVLALPLDVIREILPLPLLSRPPQVPSLLAGFFNLRGQATPVLRLDLLLGLAGRGAVVYAPLLLLKARAMGTEARPMALLVDEVRGIKAVTAGAMLPVSESDSLNGCVLAELADALPPTHVLSLESLLLERERQCISEHQSWAERRLAELGEAE
ncbi:MAG: chemotaxis protein CheW [Rhodospirillaceae bacterium]